MEVLIEIIGEIIINLMLEFGGLLIEKIFNEVEIDKKALKITKIIIYSIITLSLLTLLIISIIYKKGLIITAVTAYLIFILLSYYFIFIFTSPLNNNKFVYITRWLVRIIRYVFMISLIVLANIELSDQVAKILLIFGASLGIIIYIFIDAFRIRRYMHNKN